MPDWLQHLVVLTLVGGCAAVVGVQAFRTLRGRKSGLGACCAKGCDAGSPQPKTVFLPAAMLKKK